MKTYQIELIEPKAQQLLDELVKLKLIRVQEMIPPKQEFLQLISKIREKKVKKLSLDEITKEVESVRASRYARKQEK